MPGLPLNTSIVAAERPERYDSFSHISQPFLSNQTPLWVYNSLLQVGRLGSFQVHFSSQPFRFPYHLFGNRE
ncbi:hypothetical protein ACFX1S_007910 [Malus domestica]